MKFIYFYFIFNISNRTKEKSVCHVLHISFFPYSIEQEKSLKELRQLELPCATFSKRAWMSTTLDKD